MPLAERPLHLEHPVRVERGKGGAAKPSWRRAQYLRFVRIKRREVSAAGNVSLGGAEQHFKSRPRIALLHLDA